MGIIKTKGIILLESNMGDSDKMLTMLTPGLGKIGCAAKGARKPRSLLLSGTQFLCFGDYVLYKGKDTYNINSCETIEVFYNIRTDLDKFKYATEIAKIILNVTNENENTYRTLQLLLNTLYMISETDKNLELILAIFKLRLSCILGYTPSISRCKNCNTEENLKYFSMKDSGLKCYNCSKTDKSCIEINETTKTAITYIIKAPAKRIYSFNIPEESIKQLALIAKLYFWGQTQTGNFCQPGSGL